MKNIVTGILAHVDAGKTTCIESMLYTAGILTKTGRVDHGDALLDFNEQERARGITIYSKEANLIWKNTYVSMIDTPGHMDLSSEMERCLQVLDVAIVLISGLDGVQSHTKTIWKCLEHYQIPTIIFVNKMDISHHDKESLLKNIQTELSRNCIDLFNADEENIAMLNDDLLNHYLDTGDISKELLQQAIFTRKCFPILFGSALKKEGIQDLLDVLDQYALAKTYPNSFGAKVYKISYEGNNLPLYHVKITGGNLQVKDKISEDQKVDQIRLYCGPQYQVVPSIDAGKICVLKGLHDLYVGQGLGFEKESSSPILNAYMNYRMVLPASQDPLEMIKYCKILMQEDPQLQIQYHSISKQIHVRIMGSIQMEILQKKIEELSHVHVTFENGDILYKETISNSVIGVGHYEPLRHYAEVHIELEPLKRGSGLQYESKVSTDILPQHWQRLILTHMQEKEHLGVLTGSPITDIKMTLVNGKAHIKHTEGGDFRQATYRAIRQGLMKAHSVLLEPYYAYTLTIPSSSLSKAMYDLESRQATIQIQEKENSQMELTGKGPVRLLMDYHREVIAYTKGQGNFSVSLSGYEPCNQQEEIIEHFHYDPNSDLENPSSSIFCSKGAGITIPYNEVEEHMHLPFEKKGKSSYQPSKYKISEEEAREIFLNSGGRNKNNTKTVKTKKKIDYNLKTTHVEPILPECLIIDGYNMIYSWKDLSSLAKKDISSAREQLISDVVNYQVFRGCKVILVFDGYRVKNNVGNSSNKENTSIVYTKSGQTADSYIEKTVHELKNKYRIRVASSDGLIQNTILANGATRMSAHELETKVKSTNKKALQFIAIG